MTPRKSLDKLPCASFLVRVQRSPEEDGKVLGKKDKPKKDWDRLGIWPYPPNYNKGVYNNKECEVNNAERDLFVGLEEAEQKEEEEGNR